MIDFIIALGNNGGFIAPTSIQGKEYLIDSEFTSDPYDTWCDLSVAGSFGMIAVRDGLDVMFIDNYPSEIEYAMYEVKQSLQDTEIPIFEYLEKYKQALSQELQPT